VTLDQALLSIMVGDPSLIVCNCPLTLA
jgi:hypothetical protein